MEKKIKTIYTEPTGYFSKDMVNMLEEAESESLAKEEDIVTTILRDDFHAVNFDVNGIHYCFSGWWLLDIDGEEKEYDSKEEFLNDPIFDGKTLSEVKAENIDVELNP